MQGSSGELREMAAEGLGELVEVTSQEALRPFTVQITGTQSSAPTSGCNSMDFTRARNMEHSS